MPTAGATSSGPATTGRRWLVTAILSVVMLVGLYWVLQHGALPIIPNAAVRARIPWWAGPATALAWMGVLTLRGLRVYFLLRPVAPISVLRVLVVSFVFFGANVLLPFRTGEMVRPALFGRGRHGPLQVLGAVAAERVTDGVVLGAMLTVTLLIVPHQVPLPARVGSLPVSLAVVPAAAWTVLGVFVAASGAMAAFRSAPAVVARVVHGTVGRLSVAFAERIIGALARVAEGLSFLEKPHDAAPFVLVTLAYWAANAGSIWLLFRALGLPLGYLHAVATLGVLTLGILAPTAPGLFGTFQLGVYLGMALYLAPAEVVGAGAAVVYVLYLVHVPFTVVLSLIALVAEPWTLARDAP